MSRVFIARAAVAACLVGCAGQPESAVAPRSRRSISTAPRSAEALRASDERPALIGEYIGTYDHATGQLRFSRARNGSRVPSPGFAEASTDAVTLDDNGSSIFGVGLIDLEPCLVNQLCANVTITNDSSVSLGSVRIDIYDLDGGATIANPMSLGTNYPSRSGSAGGWNYPTLAGSGGSAARVWKFDTNAGADFSFNVAVWATYSRAGYSTSSLGTISSANNAASADATWSDAAPAWRDACLVSGSTVISGQTAFTTAGVTPAFPSSVFDTLIDTDGWAGGLEVSSAGTLSITSVLSGANLTLSDSSAPDYTFYPFWDALESTNGSVCAAVDPTSSAPARRFVATWKNVNIASLSDSRLTFSIVIREGSDDVWFLYHRWSTSPSDCSSSGTGSDLVRAGGATIGVRGFGVGQVNVLSHNTATLPSHASSCDGDGAFYRLTATPATP
ncbi:MAG: hypothetical protein JNK05_06795 [Myxococcales bacterium]|nr:hypothetical protein [Myxococcales bacterium]